MAEVNTLEEKLAEVLGLAQAAQGATEKVESLTDDEEIQSKLQKMRAGGRGDRAPLHRRRRSARRQEDRDPREGP